VTQCNIKVRLGEHAVAFRRVPRLPDLDGNTITRKSDRKAHGWPASCNCHRRGFGFRALRPDCFSGGSGRVCSTGTGVIDAYGTMRRRGAVTYTMACVTLDEDVAMMANIVARDSGEVG
jgi:hypothetical protein